MTEGGYRKECDAEYEACHILREQGWYVTRCYGERSPPDLFAARKGEFLLLMIRRSRRPITGAHAVSILYGEELERLRAIGNPDVIRKECWILSPPDGWKYYTVYPGGIRRVRHIGYDPEGEENGDENRATAITMVMVRNGVVKAITDPNGASVPDPLPRITGNIVQSPEADPLSRITDTIVRSPQQDPHSRKTGTIVQSTGSDPSPESTLNVPPDLIPRITGTKVQSPEHDPTGAIVPDPFSKIAANIDQSSQPGSTGAIEPDLLSRITGTIVPSPQPDPTGTPLPITPDPGIAVPGSPHPVAPQETTPPIVPQVNGHA